MSDTDYLKCSCQKCGEHIEFPPSAAGEQIKCPHCGGQTALVLTPTISQIISGRKLGIVAGSFLLVLVLAAVFVVYWLERRKPAETFSTVAAQTSTNAVVPEGFIELNDFQIGKITLIKAENGGLVNAVGTVKNDTDRQRFGVKVTLDLLDAEGAKIGSTSDYDAVLEPHQDWQFRALLNEPKAVKAKLTNIEEQK